MSGCTITQGCPGPHPDRTLIGYRGGVWKIRELTRSMSRPGTFSVGTRLEALMAVGHNQECATHQVKELPSEFV